MLGQVPIRVISLFLLLSVLAKEQVPTPSAEAVNCSAWHGDLRNRFPLLEIKDRACVFQGAGPEPKRPCRQARHSLPRKGTATCRGAGEGHDLDQGNTTALIKIRHTHTHPATTVWKANTLGGSNCRVSMPGRVGGCLTFAAQKSCFLLVVFLGLCTLHF